MNKNINIVESVTSAIRSSLIKTSSIFFLNRNLCHAVMLVGMWLTFDMFCYSNSGHSQQQIHGQMVQRTILVEERMCLYIYCDTV